MSERPFVPEGFEPPAELVVDGFALQPLGPEHNERDHVAWMSSIDYIHSLPGFDEPSDRWPVPMTLAENLADLERHARDFAARTGFTYTVLDTNDDDVIGCAYIYPAGDGEHVAKATCWVRESRADLDPVLRRTVEAWLVEAWPWRADAVQGPSHPVQTG